MVQLKYQISIAFYQFIAGILWVLTILSKYTPPAGIQLLRMQAFRQSRKKVYKPVLTYKNKLISKSPLGIQGPLFLYYRGLQKLSVHPGNIGQFDLFRAFSFASANIGAVTKAFFVHLVYHAKCSSGSFRLALWQ